MFAMADTGSGIDISTDRNFQRLAASETGAEEFGRLIDAHLPGYLPKKRLVEGLKELLAKVEGAENKLYLVKNLGKAKSKLDDTEQALVDKYSTIDLKEKVQSLNATCQAMIDEGRLTHEEKSQVHEQLLVRRAAAKAADKAKLLEKIENMLLSVCKAEPLSLPLGGLDEVYPLHLELQHILRLEKKPVKSLGADDRAALSRKSCVEDGIRAWSEKSRQWFETEDQFAPRLERTLEEHRKVLAEQKRREEEEAIERKRIADEQALEAKRLAAKEAEERRARELEAKLEAKRQEAALRPQKEAPQAKKKEKVKRVVLDNRDLFVPPPRHSDDEEAPDGQQDAQEAEEAVDPAPAPEPEKPKAAPKAPDAKAPAPAKVVKVVKPSIWEAPKKAEEEDEEKEEGDTGDEDAPSLQAAAKLAPVVKKTPPPAPKKKEKSKFKKVAMTDLGFDANNPNYLN